MIREWTLEDAYKYNLANLSKGFDLESKFVKTEEDYTRGMYISLMEQGIAHILVIDDGGVLKGMLAFIVAPDLHENVKVAVESSWFVLPEYRGGGKELMFAFEKKAKELGCQRTAMIHMVDSMPDILENFYLKNGYKLIEKHYVKEI